MLVVMIFNVWFKLTPLLLYSNYYIDVPCVVSTPVIHKTFIVNLLANLSFFSFGSAHAISNSLLKIFLTFSCQKRLVDTGFFVMYCNKFSIILFQKLIQCSYGPHTHTPHTDK